MAPGTRALNERKLTEVYAGLPRDLNTTLLAKTVAGLRAVFCPKVTTKTKPKHRTQERRSQAFNALHKQRPTRASGGGPSARNEFDALVRCRLTRHFIAAPNAERLLPILCTSHTHGARNQSTE
mgnify:CR=1 FL=1